MPHQPPPLFEPLEPRALLSAAAAPLPVPACPPPFWYPRETLVPCTFGSEAATITFSRSGDATTAHVVIFHGDSGYRVPDWGTVQRDGNEIRVDMKFEDWTGSSQQVETDIPHDYDLGVLPEGEYTFTLSVWGKTVATAYLNAPDTRVVTVEGLYLQRDQYRLSLGDDGDILLNWINAPAGQQQPGKFSPASIDHLLFDMVGAGDSIVLDLANGTPLPVGGMAFNVGFDGIRDYSLLTVVNASAGDFVEHTAEGLSVNGRRIIFNGTHFGGVTGNDYDLVIADIPSFTIRAGQHLRTLTISGNANGRIQASPDPWSEVLSVNELVISDDARLHVAGDLRLTVPAANQREALRTLNAYVAAGRGDGTWNGRRGITGYVSTDPPDTLATAIDPALSSADRSVLVVRRADAGDIDLDDRITSDDYFRIDSAFLAHPPAPTYADGDFNYDGRINSDDYFLIDSSFLKQPRAVATVPAAARTAVTSDPAAPLRRRASRRPVFSHLPVPQLRRR